MSKKLLDILPTLQTFQDNVISQLTNMFNGVEWLNDTTSYTKQETIYKLLILKYGDRHIRYDDENIFLNRLVFDLADFLPDIYAKQQVFIKNKLNEFLSDNKNRAVIIDNTSTNSRNTDNNTKFGNSSSPLNLVISNANEITNAPITSLNLSNVKLLENYNGNNQQVNYNFVNDLIKTLNSDYSLRLNEFMELLGKHFISVVGSYYRSQNDIQTVKDEPYRFNNGYLVNEVDYLCTDNKQEINRFNEKVSRLSDQIATKQNQLTAGSNISINNNVISANIPQTDLSNYLEKNGNLQVVNAFVDFYGNIVAKNNGYVDIVDTGAPTSMVNIRHLNDTINPINTNVSNNTAEIARVDSVVNTNSTNIVDLGNRATNLENKINNEVVKIAGDQTITGAKTFNNNVVISNNPTPLILKANNNDKTYMLIKSSDDTTNFSLGANSSNTSLEVNRGDLTIQTLQANKNIAFENAARIKFNRSVLETGTEINAGFGGGSVKFIPEDNSTKTLQFYNANPNDTRRFKLLVPEPTEAQNPTTKQYVDNLNNQNVKLAQNNTFTGTNTFNNQVSINSAGNDFTWETTRNWNQNVDNTVARTKDFKYVKKWEHISEIRPNNTWNMSSYAWTMDGINTNGIHEFFISLETRDGSLFSFNFKIMWKQGLSKSLSNKITLHKPDNDSVIDFVFAIHNDNKLHMYIKNIAGGIAINWVRCWVVRDSNLPWKVNQQW